MITLSTGQPRGVASALLLEAECDLAVLGPAVNWVPDRTSSQLAVAELKAGLELKR